MRVVIFTIALLAACGDNKKPSATPDAGGDAGPLASCLEQPDQLPMAPTGALPCELLPPGFAP